MRLFLIVCALLTAATLAYAFPFIDGNQPDRARTYALCDTIQTPAGASSRSRTIYLVANRTMGIDSTLNAWRNGGAAPAFRRMQGMRISTGGTGQAFVILTVHRQDGTSSMNRLSLQPYVWASIPLEADSIVIRSATASVALISYCVW